MLLALSLADDLIKHGPTLRAPAGPARQVGKGRDQLIVAGLLPVFFNIQNAPAAKANPPTTARTVMGRSLIERPVGLRDIMST